MTEEKRYSIGELEHMTGIKRRTIHHYISQGLLPPAVGSCEPTRSSAPWTYGPRTRCRGWSIWPRGGG